MFRDSGNWTCLAVSGLKLLGKSCCSGPNFIIGCSGKSVINGSGVAFGEITWVEAEVVVA